MPKLIPLLLQIESIAFGEALLKIHAMPGVARYEIPLGPGGEGAGRKQLEHAAAAQNGSKERTVVALLAQGPQNIREISAALGGKRSRAYGIMTALRKKHIVESLGKAMWQLTSKARAHLAPPAALPAPAKIRRGAGGRAAQGSGAILLSSMLAAGPKRPFEIAEQLSAHGMSAKSLTGVLARARAAGIIRKNGAGYELTAKGNKLNAEAVHG